MLKGVVARAPSSTLGLMLMLPLSVVRAADTLPGNIPEQLQPAVDARAFKASFEVGTWLNPFYLRGDFDGDGLADYALSVTRRCDGKKGIAVWLSTKHRSCSPQEHCPPLLTDPVTVRNMSRRGFRRSAPPKLMPPPFPANTRGEARREPACSGSRARQECDGSPYSLAERDTRAPVCPGQGSCAASRD
jgi:hypothetical protein